MLEDELADHGAIIVGPAASLAHGMQLAAAGQFDMAVIDWNLDGESSEPLARALQERGMPFVISTGYGMVPPEFADTAIMAKPYDPLELVTRSYYCCYCSYSSSSVVRRQCEPFETE